MPLTRPSTASAVSWMLGSPSDGPTIVMPPFFPRGEGELIISYIQTDTLVQPAPPAGCTAASTEGYCLICLYKGEFTAERAAYVV